jgi:competence protein ComFC
MKRFIKSKNGWSILGDGLAELVFAPEGICPVCAQERSVRQGLGRNCLERLLLVTPPVCSCCGRPLRLNLQNHSICKQCAATEYYFRQARAVALYEGALREYLADLKYRFRPELGVALGELLVEWSKLNREWRQNDLIIPVPLHQQRIAVRGYNQAELIARPLGEYWGKRILTETIIREKLTPKQNDLSKNERFVNIANAFRVLKPKMVAGKRILVIDDIMTTGATVSEVARTLLKAGALRVDVLTVATGVVESDWVSPSIQKGVQDYGN